MQIEKYTINSGVLGPNIVITGRFHGNEPVGEIVIRRLIEHIKSKKIKILNGNLTLLPVVNPIAKAQNKRYVNNDMNRHIYAGQKLGDTKEDKLRSQFIECLNTVANTPQEWHLIDIHSVDMPSAGHVIIADRNNSLKMAQHTHYDHVYSNWREAQLSVDTDDLKAMNKTIEEHQKFTLAAIYGAKEMGATSAICIEAGQHNDNKAVDKAYQSVLSMLSALGVIASSYKHAHKKQTHINFERVLIKRDETEHLFEITKDAQNLKPNQIVLRGQYRTAYALETAENWIIAHPKVNPPIGSHLGYLAKIKDS